jgi:hypothetical protein
VAAVFVPGAGGGDVVGNDIVVMLFASFVGLKEV